MDETIKLIDFGSVDLCDPFFDSLKEDYAGFDEWFEKKRKEGEKAYVQYSNNLIQSFLYLKEENDKELDDVEPARPACKRLKIGTFKIDAHNTRLGERFIKKIMDVAIAFSSDEVYVTIFPKHKGLIKILKKYGFEENGRKGGELVLVKNMKSLTGDIIKDYPLLTTRDRRKFVLSVYPKFHTKLFPDSILKNEENIREELIKDISYTNSIHKIYLCFMPDTANLRRGDIIAIYRTSDNMGPARFRSVITSICQIEEVKKKDDFYDLKDFLEYTNFYSVFDSGELKEWYRKRNVIVLKMTYNLALTKRVTRGYLLDEVGILEEQYWGFFQLSDEQFDMIIKKGEVNENIIIN